jgi:hypothetical protein
MAYLAVRISVNKPSGKKGMYNVREALRLVMDQVKILLENLQIVDPSVIFLPHKAKYRVRVESDLIATAEHIHNNYDYVHDNFLTFLEKRKNKTQKEEPSDDDLMDTGLVVQQRFYLLVGR